MFPEQGVPIPFTIQNYAWILSVVKLSHGSGRFRLVSDPLRRLHDLQRGARVQSRLVGGLTSTSPSI